MKREIGIYAIRNLQNGKMYIGQSINIYGRWKEHLKNLRDNSHYAKYLQHSFNKYGENGFIYGVIEYCSKEELNEREYYWINYYNTFNEGYNQTIPNPKTGKRSYTEEQLKQHSINAKNQWNKLSKQERLNRIKLLEQIRPDASKSVTLYNKDTFEMELEFKGFKDCAEYFNKSHKQMAKIIQKLYNFDRITYKGYIFIKEDDTLYSWKERKLKHDIESENNILKLKERRAANKKPKKELLPVEVRNNIWKQNATIASETLRNSGKYKVKVYIAETGEFYKEYNLIRDACEDLGLNRKRLSKTTWKKTKQYKGYIFEKQY